MAGGTGEVPVPGRLNLARCGNQHEASSGSQTITAVRIIDVTGKQCGFQETEVVRASSQGVLIKFEFPIYEKEGEEA